MGVKADDEPREVWRWQEAFSGLVCMKSEKFLTGSAVCPKANLDSDLRRRPPEIIYVIGAWANPLLNAAAVLSSELTFLGRDC